MSGQIISINPATLEEVGRASITPVNEIENLIAAARAACPLWRRMGFEKRASYLLKARSYMLGHLKEFAQTITEENGKPLAEALTAELFPIADLIYHFANNAERLLADFTQPIGVMRLLCRKSRISFDPLGVVGIISPWNYPFSIPAGETVMALLCGNAVLLKPSSVTPLVGKRIEEMLSAAEIPEGIFQLVSGNSETGNAIVESNIDKIIFTGSAAVGRQIMAKSSARLTPLVLELGGKDPMIVRSDADLDHASSGAVWGAFTNSGQCCASIERVYVHESIFDEFLSQVLDKTKRLRQGNGLDPTVDVGPMTTLAQLQIVESQVKEARDRGATIHCGGEKNNTLPGYFYPPTVITGVDHSFKCIREETFGPLMPVMPYKDDRQAIHLANDTAYGLTASIWSRDIKTSQKMAREIQAGTVTINECVYTHALSQTPWGGLKASGFGRTHSRFGLQELVSIRHVHTNCWTRKDMWWFPYSAGLIRDFARLTKRLTGSILAKLTALPVMARLMRLKKL